MWKGSNWLRSSQARRTTVRSEILGEYDILEEIFTGIIVGLCFDYYTSML